METLTTNRFLKLYDELAEPLFRHCYFRVSSREVAEDLTQESFTRTWTYLAQGKSIENPKAFIYRTAGNLIIDHYRRKKETSLDALSEYGFDPEGDGQDSVTGPAEGEEARKALRQLEDPYRETMILRYVDGLSVKDIAQQLGESENVISVRLHRGIEKLKKIWNL